MLKNLSNSQIIVLGIAVRAGLLLFSILQDQYLNLKYTDVDYKVQNDAARHLIHGGTPYSRHTYRYTPLLAQMMIPNIKYTDYFGKILFSCIDVASGLLLKKLLRQTTDLQNSQISGLLCVWLLNPLIIIVSTRGNADTLTSFLTLATMWFLLKKRYILAGVAFGFVVHFKIYPILYSLPFYLYIDQPKDNKFSIYNFFTKNRIVFTLVSAGTFLALLALFYQRYGFEFLYETYLYHFIRKDNRHNFSIYFQQLYLNFENITAWQTPLTFLPQFLLVILAGIKLYRDLPVCLFVQTFLFVIYNKVITAQQFVWQMVFLPLLFANNRMWLQNNKFKLLLVGGVWLVSEMLWNVFAYFLEIQGKNYFIYIWLASIQFFAVNIWTLKTILDEQNLAVLNLKKE